LTRRRIVIVSQQVADGPKGGEFLRQPGYAVAFAGVDAVGVENQVNQHFLGHWPSPGGKSNSQQERPRSLKR
jgi:hypothetical protein